MSNLNMTNEEFISLRERERKGARDNDMRKRTKDEYEKLLSPHTFERSAVI